MATSSLFILFLSCFSSVFGSPPLNTTTHFLKDGDILVSAKNLFEIGFFSPVNSTNRYVGIWYSKKVSHHMLEVIWVANRDNPLNDSTGILKIGEDGNLQLLNRQNKVFWTSNVPVEANSSPIAFLLKDTGNLVLVSANKTTIWQSFDYPTNTRSPGLPSNEKRPLRSWKSPSDPSSGRFVYGSNPHRFPELYIWDGDRPYWRVGLGPWINNSNNQVSLLYSLLFHSLGFPYNQLSNISVLQNQTSCTHIVLSYDGTLVRRDWNDGKQTWENLWKVPGSECEIYGKCGPFGICNLSPNSGPVCGCLKGFEPKNKEEWSKGNWTSGCARRKPLHCGSTIGGKPDALYKLKSMKVPDYAQTLYMISQEDCQKQCLKNCSCLAYAFVSFIGCMTWTGNLTDAQQDSDGGVDLYIRLAHSELGETSHLKIILIVSIILGITMSFVTMLYIWRRMGRLKENKNKSKSTSLFTDMVTHSVSPVELQDLQLFKFEDLMIATNNFEEGKELGHGGFGPVYKVMLVQPKWSYHITKNMYLEEVENVMFVLGKTGRWTEIAVKRLSRASGQGLQEFMNEVVLISKLQHKNLVRLLGCCAEEDENLLVYEYMPNKSLDALLFDPLHKKILDWKKRFNIINGICSGLLYLHRDSRLRVIHRDLKASNILLDEDLNPKISDFGMARIFGSKEDQANTQRVAGTYGYMSPEYAMEGRFSAKSDVYSFGVLLLEIVSGTRINSFEDDECLGLLGYAWKLWNQNNTLPLIDPTISDSSFQADILRCIQLALLCVQEFPEDRPRVSAIISMLHCNTKDLPCPSQPGFTLRRFSPGKEVSQSGQQYFSLNQLLHDYRERGTKRSSKLGANNDSTDDISFSCNGNWVLFM